MKKLFILLLCLVAVVAIISCKQDPKTEPEPTPAPKMTDEDVLDGKACYRLTATREAKRFALQYYELDGSFDPKEGDTFSLKYRSPNRDVDRIYLRDSAPWPGGRRTSRPRRAGCTAGRRVHRPAAPCTASRPAGRRRKRGRRGSPVPRRWVNRRRGAGRRARRRSRRPPPGPSAGGPIRGDPPK